MTLIRLIVYKVSRFIRRACRHTTASELQRVMSRQGTDDR